MKDQSTLKDLVGKPVITSAWATATRTRDNVVDSISYPSLGGMKVMLIIPNDFYRKKMMALGPGYVATAMQRCGIEVSILDCSAWSLDDIEIAKAVIQSGTKIFGLGGLYPMFKEIERICGIIRAVVPGATIILGGALPSPIPEFALRQTGADIATIGETEITIPSLMAALAGERDLSTVRGIAYIKEGQFFDNGKPILPVAVTKKEVGWPALDLSPVEQYIAAPKFYPFNQTDRVLPIVTGRGCPYSCNFCFRVNAYRIRPFDDLFDEMEYMIDRYRLDGFYLVDDLMMLSEKKIKGFCEGVLNRGMKIKFSCSGRVNTVTPEIARLLKEAGAISIYYGVESGSQHLLESMSKKTTLEQVYEAVRLTRENGIYCQYGLMFGQPGENEQTLRASIDLLKNVSYGEYRAQKIFGCVPFPGTGLYDWCKQTGRIKDDKDFYDRYICQDWSLDQVPVNMTELSDADATRLFAEGNSELSSFYLDRMASDWVRHFGGDIDEHRRADSSAMAHIRHRIESDANTFDTSGKS